MIAYPIGGLHYVTAFLLISPCAEDADMGVERVIPHVWSVLINASKYVKVGWECGCAQKVG